MSGKHKTMHQRELQFGKCTSAVEGADCHVFVMSKAELVSNNTVCILLCWIVQVKSWEQYWKLSIDVYQI